jgi:putative PIN family toxin of toxin-antitoxin system
MLFYRVVIDPNILISYCISARLHELPALIEKYNLEFCANETLVTEFADVIARERIKKYLLKEPVYYIETIRRFVSLHDTQIYFKGSPDINDDYLIDIVQQTSAAELVTGDKALLNWQNPPVQIISCKDFQLTYTL